MSVKIVSIVLVQRQILVFEVGYKDIKLLIEIVIEQGNPHAAVGSPLSVHCKARQQPPLHHFVFVLMRIKEIGGKIVCNIQARRQMGLHSCRHYPQPPSVIFSLQSLCCVDERPIVLVGQGKVDASLEAGRRTNIRFSTRGRANKMRFEVPVHVRNQVEIQIAIVFQIKPSGCR